ncbi:MAG TPA: SRPBCC family protein [Xanthobacteraceae bacterium]|nr:SRPBCC family protein [Xanthobacteraceae bacterium]
MEFDNSFEIPLPPDQAWPVLMDVARIAPCMPGAELTEMTDARNYKGKIAVRLGPVSLAFAGKVALEDVDDAKHTARVKAQGSDAKGRGAANASASFKVEPKGAGSIVLIHSDLMLSGAVAQYGRGVGMIQTTAAQIIGQFADNLRSQLARQPAASEATASAPASPAGALPKSPTMPPAAKPISGLSLMLRVILQQITALFGRRSDS